MMTFMFSFASANNGIGVTDQVITVSKLSLEINLGDISKISEDRASQIVENISTKLKSICDERKEMKCTIILNGEINETEFKGTISVTISGNCDEIIAEVKHQLLETFNFKIKD